MTLLELLDLMKKRIKLVIGLPIVCAIKSVCTTGNGEVS